MAGFRNVERLERSQAKIEAVRGVAESAASRILYGRMSRTIDRPPTDEPEFTGTWHGRTKGGFVQGIKRVGYSYTERMTFEDMAWWLQMILRGGVTPTSDGAATTPAYPWIFLPTTATDVLSTCTVEGGDPGNVHRSHMLAVKSATFAFDQSANPYWKMDLDLMARGDDPLGGFTVLTDRVREPIRSAGTKLYLDEGATALGTTQLLGELRSGSITINNNLEEKVFSEDVDEIHPDFGRGEQIVTAELVMEQKSRVRLDDYLTGVAQKIRIVQEGSVIHPVSVSPALPETRKRFEIDIPVGQYQSFTDQMAGQNKTQSLGVMGYTDPANPVPVKATVVNALATAA